MILDRWLKISKYLLSRCHHPPVPSHDSWASNRQKFYVAFTSFSASKYHGQRRVSLGNFEKMWFCLVIFRFLLLISVYFSSRVPPRIYKQNLPLTYLQYFLRLKYPAGVIASKAVQEIRYTVTIFQTKSHFLGEIGKHQETGATREVILETT